METTETVNTIKFYFFLSIFLVKTFSTKIFCQLLNLELDVKDFPEVTKKINA